jgi:transposase
LVRGKRIGVDASTMEANAALRTIVRRDDGRTYREMLTQMAKESGIETPTADDLVRLDRARQGKKLSNQEWVSATDPQAKIAKLKDGRTRLAYKPEHAVDLDTGIIVAAALHPADQGDTTTIESTLLAAQNNLAQISAAPTKQQPGELAADKGYHSRAVLKALDTGVWKTRIAEPKQVGFSRWHGDDKARAAVYANRTRLGSGVGKQAMRRRAEIVERSFAHNLDRGGMRRTWLRGRENVHKRYLVHVAGHNLGILMRLLIGAGTPRAAAARGLAYLFFVDAVNAVAITLVVASPDGFAILVIAVTVDPARSERDFSNGLLGRRCCSRELLKCIGRAATLGGMQWVPGTAIIIVVNIAALAAVGVALEHFHSESP